MQTIVLDGVDTGAQCKAKSHNQGDYVMLMGANGLTYAKVVATTETALELKTVTQTEWEIATSSSNLLTVAVLAVAVAILIALASCLGLSIATANL